MTTKIIRGDGITELANIKSCVYIEQVNSSTDLRGGCVSSASIEVNVFNTQQNAVTKG